MTDRFSHFELKQLRTAIGASTADMALKLGLYGNDGPDIVRQMENGAEPIPGPMQVLARYIQQGLMRVSFQPVSCQNL